MELKNKISFVVKFLKKELAMMFLYFLLLIAGSYFVITEAGWWLWLGIMLFFWSHNVEERFKRRIDMKRKAANQLSASLQEHLEHLQNLVDKHVKEKN